MAVNLQNTVGGWREFGFSPREAVRELVAIHLRYGNAKGGGNRARRRTIALAQKLDRMKMHPKAWVMRGTGLT